MAFFSPPFRSLNAETLIFVVWVWELLANRRETQKNDFQWILPMLGVYINSATDMKMLSSCPTT